MHWEGKDGKNRRSFNEWRAKALDLFIQDTGAIGGNEVTEAEDDLYTLISEQTGLPKSLIALGSDESDTKSHMTADMRKVIHDAMRSNIILHAEEKGIGNREVPKGKEVTQVKPLEVTPEDLEPHYENEIAESAGYSDNTRKSIEKLKDDIANFDYAATDAQGTGKNRADDRKHLARLLKRPIALQGTEARNDLRQEAAEYNYQFPTEESIKDTKSLEDLDVLFGSIKDAEPPKKEGDSSSDGRDQVGADIKTDKDEDKSSVDKLSEEARKRQEEDQARKDEGEDGINRFGQEPQSWEEEMKARNWDLDGGEPGMNQQIERHYHAAAGLNPFIAEVTEDGMLKYRSEAHKDAERDLTKKWIGDNKVEKGNLNWWQTTDPDDLDAIRQEAQESADKTETDRKLQHAMNANAANSEMTQEELTEFNNDMYDVKPQMEQTYDEWDKISGMSQEEKDNQLKSTLTGIKGGDNLSTRGYSKEEIDNMSVEEAIQAFHGEGKPPSGGKPPVAESGDEEVESDGPAAIQWKEGDNYGTALPAQQIVRDANGDLYMVRQKKGYMLELDGIDEEGNSKPSGNRTVNVNPSSDEYDKENEYFRHEINGQSTHYNLLRANKGLDPLQINDEDLGKNEEGDPLPNIPDRVRKYLEEAGNSDEEIKALFDTGELHDGEGNPIQLQTIKEQFPMKQQEGGEESTGSKEEEKVDGVEAIKNIIVNQATNVDENKKEDLNEASSENLEDIIREIIKDPVELKDIPSMPLQSGALDTAMQMGLFDMEGNPTPRGTEFLNLMGERFENVQSILQDETFRENFAATYKNKNGDGIDFNKGKPVEYLSNAALKHMADVWNAEHGEDNQMDYTNYKWNDDATAIVKTNGETVEDDFYTKSFNLDDDNSHTKAAQYGEGEGPHDHFTQMMLSAIVAGRIGNAASNDIGDFLKGGGVFANVFNEKPPTDNTVTNEEIKVDEVQAIVKPQENQNVDENEIVDETKIVKPTPTKQTTTESNVTVTPDNVGDQVETTAAESGGTPPLETPSTATGGDSGEFQESRTRSTKKPQEQKVEATPRDSKINSLMIAEFDENWETELNDNEEIQEQHEHFKDMDDNQFKAKYTAYMDAKSTARKDAKKASADAGEEETVEAPKELDREQYYEELAKHDEISIDEARQRYGNKNTYDDAELLKKVRANHNRKPNTKETEDLDRDAMLDKIADMRDMSREDIETEYEHHDDKEVRQVLHGQINQKATREATDKKSDQDKVGKQNARDANASLKNQFKTPMEVKNEFDPKREGAGEDGEMSTTEAADMFRSLLQHASQNHNHYDDEGIARLNELNHNLVRHLENSPEGMEALDKIHSEVQMASDLDMEYGSQEWYDHLEKTVADRAEKETREQEQKEADDAEANEKFNQREAALDRAFAHPHNKDHSNRLHSFDLEIEIGEDGKPTVTNAEHKGGIHHFEHSDGVVRENQHDASSHRGSGRSEHAPHDPDHTPEQAEIYQRIHAHRQRMDDLESPIRETERKHSKEKSDLQRTFDGESKKRAGEHGRKRTRIQDAMHKKHAKITEAYDEEMGTLSADLDEVTLTIQEQMDALKKEHNSEFKAIQRETTDLEFAHKKELSDLDAEQEQDRKDFDRGTGKWGEELQRTNPEAAARYADPEQREAVKEEMYNTHSRLRVEVENKHADQMEEREAVKTEFEGTAKEATEELQGNIVGAKKELRDKMRDVTSKYKEESDQISAKANEDYDLLDKYTEGIEADELDKHNTNKESLASKQQGELEEAVGAAGSDMIEASRLDGMLKEEYLNSATGDSQFEEGSDEHTASVESARERLNNNLDNSDLGATENSFARHAGEESERIQGEAQEAAQGMMDEDTPPPGSPSPTNANLVYKPGPGKNWVTRDSYQAAVAKGLLARNNNAISFSNQGGNIIAHHGTDSWEVSEGVEGKGARTSQESIGNEIHRGASQWTDEDGTSFADKAGSLKEGESFEISNDHFNEHSPALVRGLKGQKPDDTTPTTDATSTETGETPEEPQQGASSKFLGRMGTKVFSPAAQAVKQTASKAKQNFANDLRAGRWAKTNMSASGQGSDKRYSSGFMSSYDPDKDHVGEASLGRELNRLNPFKGQKAKAEISTENQVENRSRQVQALATHVQGQNKTLAQMSGQKAPTVKPTVGASTQTLSDHVASKQNAGKTPPTPPAAT